MFKYSQITSPYNLLGWKERVVIVKFSRELFLIFVFFFLNFLLRNKKTKEGRIIIGAGLWFFSRNLLPLSSTLMTWDIRFIQNIGYQQQNCVALQPRKLYSKYLPPWKFFNNYRCVHLPNSWNTQVIALYCCSKPEKKCHKILKNT